ncbi:seminal vesicle secretory protein 6-like [Arvicanthis niloticus]|uniref:seminal vesicle secretory protein 6-like n=1 Tax=Arvicanthis niloticus TaxID=61156 RepID=UPI0014864313|nr:seminal vesicle secretory protein 6-like [Arvicanthis niloticus]
MSPTSFFLLTLLLVLVTEAASRRPREKFSQSAEEYSSESSEAKSPKSVIHEEVYEEKKFKENVANGDDGDDRRSLSAGEIERSYTRKKEKQRFAQEMAK